MGKQLKASKVRWNLATANLNDKRSVYQSSESSSIGNYTEHLKKCGYGKSILDIGCGSQFLKTCIPSTIRYIGLDAFPIVDETIHCAIEDFEGMQVETVCAFAVLDNCRDFNLAIQNMKKIATKNIIILTGIDIEVDKYHTFNLQHEDFKRNFQDWDQTHFEEISPKVFLLCYQPK